MKNEILSIDDAKFFQDLLKGLLLPHGYSFIAAKDAAEGIKMYTERKPLCVLLDVVMPGMDGVACACEIKKIDKEAKIFILSACITKRVLSVSFKIGITDILNKDIMIGNNYYMFNEKTLIRIKDGINGGRKYKYDENKIIKYMPEYQNGEIFKQDEIDKIMDICAIPPTAIG